MPTEEETPTIIQPQKSSMEILSELFGSFDAEPPVIVKKEKDDTKRHHKKGKKKHKKDKKHKKKDKKRKRSDSNSSQRSGVDLAELLIKQERQSPEKKIKLESSNCPVVEDEDSKITIKDIKFSSILEANMCKVHNGHVSVTETEPSAVVVEKSKKKKHKHKHDDKLKKKKRVRRSPSKEKVDKNRSKIKAKERSPESDSKNKDKLKNDKYNRYRDRDKNRDREGSRERDRGERKSKFRERSRSTENYTHKHKEHLHHNEDKWFMKDRYRGYSDLDKDRDKTYKDRSRSRDTDTRIDKKKLLEIARRNAIQMMKSGNLPGALTLGRQAQEKVLAAIRAGGKTIEELTDFCKTLSKKEELGELSSVSGEEGDSDNESRAFHHPFQIKDRPTGIVMNIKNSIPLPTKTAQERTTELRMQFPVSSGTQHRKTENEWVPVSPKKTESPPSPPVVNKPIPIPAAPPIPAEPPPAPVPPVPLIFLEPTEAGIDIGAIVSQRLTAMRKLQENPYDVEALNEMHKSQKEMQSWAESKQQPGQFTGSTGAQILTQAELSSGYQAWARKDQLQNAAPVCGGMGMHLLKKMGWNPGEGLGKEKTGALEPLLLEVKLDKKGLVANEEQKRKQQKLLKSAIKTLEGKHPVSLLGEFTAKKKLGAPQYTLCMESGPDHKKLFLFKVTVNSIEYKPDAASPNKKQAKADAAKLCLQQMGLLAATGK